MLFDHIHVHIEWAHISIAMFMVHSILTNLFDEFIYVHHAVQIHKMHIYMATTSVYGYVYIVRGEKSGRNNQRK